MSKSRRVEPRTLKGFNDHLPESEGPRRRAIAAITAVYERYGFNPVDSPVMEHLETLFGTGGEETNKEIFRLTSPEGEEVGLRFDLTVPFSRLMAQYPDKLKTPFRRFSVGKVYRADKPDPWRFREFTQVDIDVAGCESVAADAEVIAVMTEAIRALGIDDFAVVVNHRGFFDALLAACGITDEARQKHVLRVIDKLKKVGIEKVRQELGPGRVDDSGDPIKGVQLEPDAIEQVLAFIACAGDTRASVMDAVEAALPQSPASEAALAAMREIADCLNALGVSEKHARFAPSLARGLDYYTGAVFEIVIDGAEHIGSVGGGGRYDGLVERFLNRPMPCVGASIGLDRVMGAMAAAGLVPESASQTQVLVVTMGNVPRTETLTVAAELRAAGIRTEAYMASKKKMKMGNQLSHADHYGIPVAVILGEDEVAQGLVSVKDLEAGKAVREDIEDRDEYREAGTQTQETIPRAEMIACVQAILGK